jgi:hypothetical protein
MASRNPICTRWFWALEAWRAKLLAPLGKYIVPLKVTRGCCKVDKAMPSLVVGVVGLGRWRPKHPAWPFIIRPNESVL